MVKIELFYYNHQIFFGIKLYDVRTRRRYDRCGAIYQHTNDAWKYIQ